MGSILVTGRPWLPWLLTVLPAPLRIKRKNEHFKKKKKKKKATAPLIQTF